MLVDLHKDSTSYKKEYLPGYTGFVPTKNDMFGMTAGDINRKIVESGGSAALHYPIGSTHALRFYRLGHAPVQKQNKEIYGNWSKFGKNWICGPTHEVQLQHVPGYTGHVSGVVSENIFAKSYAKCTSNAISKKHPKGYDVPPNVRYLSQSKAEFHPKNFRRFVENPELKPKKDYDDYTKFVNDEFVTRKEGLVAGSYQNSPDGYQSLNTLRTQQGFKKGFRANSTAQTVRNSISEGYQPLINDVKPKLLESKVSENQLFFGLSDGFKKIFANDKKDQKLIIPIVGYGGHRRGDRSQNFFGKSFRDTTIQSKRLERNLLGNSLQV